MKIKGLPTDKVGGFSTFLSEASVQMRHCTAPDRSKRHRIFEHTINRFDILDMFKL